MLFDNTYTSKPVTEPADSGVLTNVSSSGTIDISTNQSPNSTPGASSSYHDATALIIPIQTNARPITTVTVSGAAHAAVLSAPPETTQRIAAPDPASGSLVSSALSQNIIGTSATTTATAVAASSMLQIINQPMTIPAVTPSHIPMDLASWMQSQTVIQPIATTIAAPSLVSSTPSTTSAQPVPIIHTTTTTTNIPAVVAVLSPTPIPAPVAAESMLTIFAQSMDRDLADLRQFLCSDYFDDVNEVGMAEFEEELRRDG